MKYLTLATLGAALVFTTACATKRYPIATELSAVEQSELTCRELAIELAKVDETEAKIANTAETDWRSAAGFLGDFGIGNAMAKSEATKALSDRKLSIRDAQVAKECL
ncbi:MAG: lipoprotein [Henriciella sp.]